MQIVSGNEHVTFSYDQARAAISEIEAAISQEQLKSEDKDAAPGNADGNQRQNNARKEAGCDKGSACWAEGLFDKCRKQLGGSTDTGKYTRFVLKKKNGRMGSFTSCGHFFCRVPFCFTTFTGCRCRT